MKVRLLDGQTHPVDSSSMAFEIAGQAAFRNGAPECKPIVMEPYMRVEVVTPEEYQDKVVGDLCSRRGILEKTETKNSAQQIIASVPLSSMFSYISDLRSLSKGRASFSMELDKYMELPAALAEE